METKEIIALLLLMALAFVLGIVVGNFCTDVRCDICGAICDTIDVMRLEREDATVFVCNKCRMAHVMKLLDKEKE